MPRAVRKCVHCELDITTNAGGIWRTVDGTVEKCEMAKNLRHKPSNKVNAKMGE